MRMDRTYFEKLLGYIDQISFDWNPQCAWRGLPSKTLWRTVEEEALQMAKTWEEVVKGLAS